MDSNIKQQKICGYLIGIIAYWGNTCSDINEPTLLKDANEILERHKEFGLTTEEMSKLKDLQAKILEFVRSLSTESTTNIYN